MLSRSSVLPERRSEVAGFSEWNISGVFGEKRCRENEEPEKGGFHAEFLEQLAEKSRLVKIGLFGCDRKARQVMRPASPVAALVDVSENFCPEKASCTEQKCRNGNLDFPGNFFPVENRRFYRAQDSGVLRRKEFFPVNSVPAACRIAKALACKLEIDVFVFGVESVEEKFDAAVFPGVSPVLADVCREAFPWFRDLEAEVQKIMVFLKMEDDGGKHFFVFVCPKAIRN